MQPHPAAERRGADDVGNAELDPKFPSDFIHLSYGPAQIIAIPPLTCSVCPVT